MGTNIQQLILDGIEKSDEPVRFTHIMKHVMGERPLVAEGSIRTVLSSLVRNKLVVKVKYPLKTSFYCRPEWVGDDGKISIPGWDPHWKNKIPNNEDTKKL